MCKEIKGKMGKLFWWKPISTALGHFPVSALRCPRERCQPCKTTVQTKLIPGPTPGPLQGTDCFRLGAPAGSAAAGGEHRVSGFVLTLPSVLQLEKSQTCPSMLKPPERLWWMSPKCLLSSLILRMAVRPWRGPEWSQAAAGKQSYLSGTEPCIYSLQLDVERLKEPALKIPLHHPSGVHP